MAQIWVYSLLAVLVVSLVSFAGAITLAISEQKLQRWLLYLVSFSAGALLGDVFLHLLPEMAENGFSVILGLYLLIGILVFFILERFILWQHSHSGKHEESVHSVVYLTQFGDSLHNFLDGMIIAASFLVSVPVGIATSIAVIFHEIPQEIGNFAILIHGGWSKKKALFYNFLSGLTSVAGALLVLVFFRSPDVTTPTFLLSLGVASFIYIALSDIVPELHQEKSTYKSMLQLTWFILGIAVMGLLLLLE